MEPQRRRDAERTKNANKYSYAFIRDNDDGIRLQHPYFSKPSLRFRAFVCLNPADREGATMVEGAIILSVTLLLIFGGLELGLAVTRYNALSEGARRAARCAMVRGAEATQLGSLGPTTMQFTADASNTIANSFRYVLATINPADVHVRVEWLDGTNQVDDRVRVTLQYQHQAIVPSLLGFGNFDFQAVSTVSIGH